MFFTNAFVNLSEDKTSRHCWRCPLSFFRTSHYHWILTSHRWQSTIMLELPLAYISLWSPGQTFIRLSGNSTLFQYSLGTLIDKKLADSGCGGFVSRNECETWLCTLESRDWGWVSEKECVLNITDIVTVTCLKMDVTSLNKLQSPLWFCCDGNDIFQIPKASSQKGSENELHLSQNIRLLM